MTEEIKASAPQEVERFYYDDEIVKKFTLATLVWALVAFLLGIYIALEMAYATEQHRAALFASAFASFVEP